MEQLFATTQDILYVVTASSIALLTIMVCAVCFQLISFMKRLKSLTQNLEDTTDAINTMIRPASIVTHIVAKVAEMLSVVTAATGGKAAKKRSTKKTDE